jgi:hypothetical protein
MIGEGGDPSLDSALRASLVRLLEVFPEHLAKPRPPTWFDPEDIARNDQFDAMLRAHKKDRLAIPIIALRALGSPYHNFTLIHPRRLAWFVPSLLASWLDRALGATDLESLGGDATIVDEEWQSTDEEAAALAEFFEAALAAALATQLAPARAPDFERPLEDGVRVWSLHSPSVPLDVLRVATALRVPLEPLLTQWIANPTPLALDHLLEAATDSTVQTKHYLAHEAVADRLGAAFFEARGERQVRLSKAEATVRRNIARRADY